MFGSSAASRRARRAQRLLIALQVLLLVFSLAAPAGTIAADSSAPPSDRAEPATVERPVGRSVDAARRPDAGSDSRADTGRHARSHRDP